jgi:iron-sulfur cluster assembly protein
MNDVVQHSRHDTPVLVLSDAATQHVLSYLEKQNQYQGVRFSVKKTGCSGLAYVIDYVEQAVAGDVVLPLAQGYFIYIDKKSYPYLKGLAVDYVQQGLNRKLIFNNPNQTGQCGCGESFTVE